MNLFMSLERIIRFDFSLALCLFVCFHDTPIFYSLIYRSILVVLWEEEEAVWLT